MSLVVFVFNVSSYFSADDKVEEGGGEGHLDSRLFVFFIEFEEYKYKYLSGIISRATPCNKGITVPFKIRRFHRQSSSTPCKIIVMTSLTFAKF